MSQEREPHPSELKEPVSEEMRQMVENIENPQPSKEDRQPPIAGPAPSPVKL